MVARILEVLGAVVIDADQLARAVVAPGEPAYHAIVAEFGEGILKPDRTINRGALGQDRLCRPAGPSPTGTDHPSGHRQKGRKETGSA